MYDISFPPYATLYPHLPLLSHLPFFSLPQVETIGDAYILVSGLPESNGTRHSVEVCDAALDILKTTKNYIIPHMPHTQIKIRIGIHSGMEPFRSTCVVMVTLFVHVLLW